MISEKNIIDDSGLPPFELMKTQRSHILFVLSNSEPNQSEAFMEWYKGNYLYDIAKLDGVLSVQHFQRHELDITMGHYPPPDYQYLGIYELSLDGAEMATDTITYIIKSYEAESCASEPATWLYYPVSEKVGRPKENTNSMIVLAFANAVPGAKAEFVEWYCTRHIRHALNASVLVSGQCFGLTEFQISGSREPSCSTIAIYEQEGTPEELLDCFKSLDPELFDFPTLDTTCFGEAVFYPVSKKVKNFDW